MNPSRSPVNTTGAGGPPLSAGGWIGKVGGCCADTPREYPKAAAEERLNTAIAQVMATGAE